LNDIRYPYKAPRPGQVELSGLIVDAVLKRRNIAVEAPSGFGKTAVALAAINHLTSSHGFNCIYAVRTKREVDRVLEEAKKFGQSLTSKTAPLLSMADGCLLKNLERTYVPPEVMPQYCKANVLSGRCLYYNALSGIGRFAPARPGSVDEFIKLCDSLRVCPYYQAKTLASGSDIIVTTFPHLLSEALRTQLLAHGRGWHRTFVIFDEAHNLNELVYSSTARSVSVNELRNLMMSCFRTGKAEYYNFASGLSAWALSIGIREGEEMALDAKELRRSPLLRSRTELLLLSESAKVATLAEPPVNDPSFVGRLRLLDFAAAISRSAGRDDARLFLRAGEGDVSVAVKFLDVCGEFAKVMERFWSIVLMSATFFSFDSFAASIGVKGSQFVKSEEDPLARSCVTVIDSGVTTEFSRRSRSQYEAIAARAASVARASKGSVAVFFPSYEILESVSGALSDGLDGFLIVKERRAMTRTEQASAVLAVASQDRSVLLGVMGGRFSEGEDFGAGCLSSVVIVGLPLSPPSKELSVRLAYAKEREGAAATYDSLVLVPAVAKVVQSAGRLFRRKEQVGLVALLDRRFTRRRIIEMLPQWMRQLCVRFDVSDGVRLRDLLRIHGLDRSP